MGFQLQTGQPTIQGEIEKSLKRFTGETIRIRGASRTDSGAHARGQVVDFVTRSRHGVDIFPRALNHHLPRDIRVVQAYHMVAGFHSRRDAISRTYRYHILNRAWPSPLDRHTCFWVRDPLDAGSMTAAAQGFLGIHDFRALGVGHPAGLSAVRRVSRWDVWREEENVIIECEANGFLRHQIRRANAILIEVGKGRLPTEVVKDILEGGHQSKRELAPIPALGLCLMKVTYPNFWSKVKSGHEAD